MGLIKKLSEEYDSSQSQIIRKWIHAGLMAEHKKGVIQHYKSLLKKIKDAYLKEIYQNELLLRNSLPKIVTLGKIFLLKALKLGRIFTNGKTNYKITKNKVLLSRSVKLSC